MTTCYTALDRVNISGCDLSGVTFRDTGGTNGWIADPLPDWLTRFILMLPVKGQVTQAVLRMLKAGIGIPPHQDPKRYTSARVVEHRYHVPLVTHPACTMRWPDDGVEVHLEAGRLYEVDHNERVHEVVQRAPIDRVHVCVDTLEVLE